jgi:hypothetical protein
MMKRTASSEWPTRLVGGFIASLVATTCIATAAGAAEFFVNNASGACSNTGPGTQAAPYCSITAALTAHHEPGVIITVLPGLYREQVTLPASGTSGTPITVRAQAGSGAVVVDGTDDFSNTALWTQFSGNVWQAASVTTAPVQVFADDQRLTPSSSAPGSLPSRSFTFVAGSGLFVNAGGGNPGTHQTQVGRRTRGFFVSGKSFVVIQGFTVTRCDDRCIQLTNSSNIEVNGNTLTFSGGIGLQASGDSADRIVSNRSFSHANHGFSFVNRTVETTLDNNEAFGNVNPAARSANGVFVSGSMRNVIRNNRWHDNQDSGEQFSPGCADNISIQNRSWNNGDHGFDHNGATGTLHVNEVAYHNFNDGYSIEGTSTGTRVFNAISIENGTTNNGFDLFVDTLSTAGFQSDDNVFWNSGPQTPVRISQSNYSSVASYSAARAQDTRTAQADPRFANAAGGDFQLTTGSPAIDNGNSGVPGWPSTDAECHIRHDDPGTPNHGQGPVTFADRGALEFQGATPGQNQPPTAQLTVTPNSGTAPLAVKADATASSDADGRIVSFKFDFGDGTVVGPQASGIANHTYGVGQFNATVTVTDDQGATATASAHVSVVGAVSNRTPFAALVAQPDRGVAPLTVKLDASGSRDPDGRVVSYRFEYGDGATDGPQPSPIAHHTYGAGRFTAKVTVTDDKGATASASVAVTVDAAAANRTPVARLKLDPKQGRGPLRVRADATGSDDPDGRIVSYRFDFGDGTTAGPQSSPIAQHTYGVGHWSATVVVTDDQGATASASDDVRVAPPAPANFAANASFEADLSGWAAIGGARMQRVPGGHSGGFSLLAAAPLLGLGGYGITDQPDWVQITDGAGVRYHFRAWIRAELGVGLVTLRVKETLGDRSGPTMSSTAVQIGSGWAPVDLDYFTRFNGSRLDLQIMNAPSIVGTAFRVDDVTISLSEVGGSISMQAGEEVEDAPIESAFTAAGVHPNPVRADGARIVFSTSLPGPSEVVVYDLAGRAVRRLTTDPGAAPGVQFVTFDGLGQDGGRLRGGMYYYQVRSPDGVRHGRFVMVE